MYCLAEAAARFHIYVLGWATMSNHYHLIIYDHFGVYPAFIEHLNKMLARCLNRRWGRWENLWSTEQACVTYLPTPDAIFDKLVYLLANPVADHLVDRVVDWPGLSSLHLMDGREIVCKRPKEFFRQDGSMPKEVTLRIAPPPAFTNEPWAEWVVRVHAAVANIENSARQERLEKRTRVVGRKAILAASPFHSPSSAAPRGNLRPSVACRNEERRKAELATLKEFRRAYREARLNFLAGDHEVEFPEGTYRLRILGARCAPFPLAA